MKTLVLGLCILGLTNLITAQNDISMVTTNVSDISTTTTKPPTVKNELYLNTSTTNVKHLALCIKELQQVAAAYDITKEGIYTTNKSITYDVVFKTDENYIKAVYDHNGIIISSEEYYENVRIPYALSSQLAKDYPSWSFSKSHCTISYTKDGEVTYTYKLKLKKGNSSKTITRTI